MTALFKSFKKFDDLEDDDWADNNDYASVYSDNDSVSSWEMTQLMTLSLAKGGRDVVRNKSVKKEGFEGLNAWRREHGKSAVTLDAYHRSLLNTRWNVANRSNRTVDPGRIDRMIGVSWGVSKTIDDILNDYKKLGVVAPFIDYNLKNPSIVYWVGNEEYRGYIARLKSGREDEILKKQRDRYLKKQQRESVKALKNRYAKSFIGVPVTVKLTLRASDEAKVRQEAIHEVKSSLNGNNGEWTNGDDLPAKKGFRKPKSSLAGSDTTVATVQSAIADRTLYQCSTTYGTSVFYDGVQYTVSPRDPQFLVEEGTQLEHVVQEGCGYCIVGLKGGCTRSMRSLFFEVVIPAYTHQETRRFYPAERILALLSFYEFLRITIGGAVPTISLSNAAISWSTKNLPHEIAELIRVADQTPRAYVCKMAYVLATQSPLISCLTDDTRPVNIDGSHLLVSMDVHPDRTNWCIPDEQYIDPGYVVRRDFKIIKFDKSLQAKIDRDAHRDLCLPWVCDYFTTDQATKFQTAYMRFVGSNTAPFIEYGNTAVNVLGGLKRILGSRECEEYYRFKAKNLGDKILQVLLSPREVMYVYTSSINEIYKLVSTRKYSVVEPEAPPGALFKMQVPGLSKWVATKVSILIARNSRSTIQYFVDKTHTVGSWAYYATFYGYLTLVEPLQSRECNANIPHVKRKLRAQYVKNQLIHSDDRYMVPSRIDANVKREWAKPGKAPRLFVSYGEGCMYANEIPEYGKVCIDGFHYFREGKFDLTIYVMAKPMNGQLDMIFERLFSSLSCNNSVFCAIYSDDQVYGGCINGVPFCYNVDISSNDSSQDLPAFLVVGTALAHFNPNRAIGLLTQCTKPIRISNPTKKDEYFDIKMEGPFEGSGTVLTTLLNHYASTMGALASFYTLARTGADFLNCIEYGFAQVGHKVTIQECLRHGHFCFEKVQFLKHSPMRSALGEWVAVKNFGCIFRSLGVVWDSLTYTSLGVSHGEFINLTDNQRVDKMCGDVVAGLCHEPANVVMDALRERFKNGKRVESTTLYDSLHVGDGSSAHTIAVESICARYDLTESDLTELSTLILAVKAGCTVRCQALARFYQVDYDAQNILSI